jgi:Mn-dependent DtxR family transcriptional regulator
MLEDVLRLIARGEVAHLGELADQLGVSQDLGAQMVEDLGRLGYLRLDRIGCTETCQGCSLATGCSVSTKPRLWTVTPKGQALLGRDPAG